MTHPDLPEWPCHLQANQTGSGSRMEAPAPSQVRSAPNLYGQKQKSRATPLVTLTMSPSAARLSACGGPLAFRPHLTMGLAFSGDE